jgi:exodeoxyribonuclease V alpha subunit
MNYSPHHTFAHYFKDEKLAPYFYALSKKMEDGNICISIDNLPQDLTFWHDFGEIDLSNISFQSNSFLIGNSFKDNKPFVLHNQNLYIARNEFYEARIVEQLNELAKKNEKDFEERRNKLLEIKSFVSCLQSNDANLQDFEANEKPDWQLVAVIQGFLHNITIITGGPGTGKTTTVAKILSLLNKVDKDLSLALIAPTARAGARMKESLLNTIKDTKNRHLGIDNLVNDLKSTTIHRLLGSIHDSPFFKHHAENPLEQDVIIVDESSMIGAGLFAKLLDAIKPGARLILLGDSEQLASVDAGSLFGDLCKALQENENKFLPEHLNFLNSFLEKERNIDDNYKLVTSKSHLDERLVRLKKTYRYDQKSKMGQFTKAVIKGREEDLSAILEMKEDSLLLDENYDEQIFTDFVNGYQEYLQEENKDEALKSFNKLRVLCAVRQGEQGIYAINRKIENQLKKKFELASKDGFYHNQPIMVTMNNPTLNLFNGDVGIVRKDENGQLKAYFHKDTDGEADNVENNDNSRETNLKAINPALISNWETVFAMTIHKSQGSEFDKVLVILPKQKENRLLTRELLYTGVTRAKTKAIVQASLELVQQTTKEAVNRVSGIQERIKIN